MLELLVFGPIMLSVSRDNPLRCQM